MIYLLNAARAEGRSEAVTNSSPVVILSNRHGIIKVAIQFEVLKDKDAYFLMN